MTDDNNADGPLSDPTQFMPVSRQSDADSGGLLFDPTQTFGRQSDAVVGRTPDDEPKTGLIRRAPTGAIPVADAPATSIIRRTPTGAIPVADSPQTTIIEPATGLIVAESAPATTFIPATPDAAPPAPKPPPGPLAACATATACILSGWATAVIATSLIAGWWHTDPLFCVAIGFLAAVSAGATIGGQIAVLLRHRTGRMLVVVGALVTLVIFASLFVAGAKLPPIVYGIPVLPIASMVLAMLPVTGRWCTKT
ncbi:MULTISPECIES: hypothetical protein [unclassified Mycolicibacterium]|uniref:hypothetical protein n=1 Tax=unclassified Mycolicibacterium TaxID=2636767 RepID=UPI002815906C|nr:MULTISPECIES: hypothetical protein [unclassified Mycolicibacterium]